MKPSKGSRGIHSYIDVMSLPTLINHTEHKQKVQYTVHCTQYTIHNDQINNKQYTVHTTNKSQLIVKPSRWTQSTNQSAHFTIYTLQCTLYNSTHYKVQLTKFILHVVQITQYKVQITQYIVQSPNSTSSTLHSTHHFWVHKSTQSII